jgi:hypothetical protein
MPKEDRRIIFDNAEVYKAIYALCSQKQIDMPPQGQIESLKVDDQDEAKIFVVITNPHDESQDKASLFYSRDFFAAALMLYCRGLGIPLPKRSRKSVLIKEGQVMLRVQI